MSFNLPMTPEDMPDYEYEAEVARLERNTGEIEDTAVTEWLGGRQGRLDEVEEDTSCQ